MKFNVPVAISGIALAMFPYLFAALGASSLALGTLLGILLAVFIGLLVGARLRSPLNLLYFFTCAVSLNIIATSAYYWEWPSLQQVASTLFAAIFILYAGFIVSPLHSVSTLQLARLANSAVIIAIALGIVSLVFEIHLLPLPKSILYFSEPSHFAIGLAPFILYTVLANRLKLSFCIAASTAVLGIGLENLTLLVLSLACLGIVVVRSRLSRLLLFAVAFTLLSCSLFLLLNIEYYSSRILLDSNNISSLVFLRGYEASVASLTGPPFLGVGFQVMALRAPSSSASVSLDQLGLGDLNQNDGGFIAAKLLTEFGWPGLLVLVYLLAKCIPLLLNVLRLSCQGVATKSDNVFASCVVAVLIQLFVRGSGYLGPFLVLSALAYYFRPVCCSKKGVATC